MPCAEVTGRVPLLSQDLFIVLRFSDRVAFFLCLFFIILERGKPSLVVLVSAITGDQLASWAYTSLMLSPPELPPIKVPTWVFKKSYCEY